MSVNGRTYVPKPGSVADRALAFLQSQPAAGAEVSTSALAEAANATGEAVRLCLQPALDGGLVFARKKGGHPKSPLFWSLVNHEDMATPHASTTPGNDVVSKLKSEIPDGRASQHVLKAEAARPDATDRETPANASPVGGPMGVGQSAAADPAGDGAPLVGRTATLSMTGEVAVVAECGTVILFDAQRGRQLVEWLAGRAA